MGAAGEQQAAVDHHLGRPAVRCRGRAVAFLECRVTTAGRPHAAAGKGAGQTDPVRLAAHLPHLSPPAPHPWHRTLVLLGGEPVPLSAATSPAHSPYQGNSPAVSPTQSPMARDRSPLARSPMSRSSSGVGSPLARPGPMALRLQLLRAEGAAGSGASSLGSSSGRGVGTFRHIFAMPQEGEQAQQEQQPSQP